MLVVVLICSSLMISDVEHLFDNGSLAIRIPLEKCQVLCPFLNWLFFVVVVPSSFPGQYCPNTWHMAIFENSGLETTV